MTATPAQALATIRDLADRRVDIGIGMCQKNAHTVYGIGSGADTAALAWAAAKYRHPSSTPPTPGAFLFWTGGHTIVNGEPAGHVAIADTTPGWCWSPGGPTDEDHWVRIPIASIATGWPGHTYAGWSEDINGVRVPGLAPTPTPAPTPNPATPKLTPVESARNSVLAEATALQQTATTRKRPGVAARAKRILAILRGIK